MTTTTELWAVTRHIAGHKITLTEGVRYLASRPFARRGMRAYDVTIEPIGNAPDGARRFQVTRLTYDEANALLAAFNDGPMSFDGRVW